jgi:hypothetical protein
MVSEIWRRARGALGGIAPRAALTDFIVIRTAI